MLTLKEHTDGLLYHYQLDYDETNEYWTEEGGEWILDEQGSKILSSACLCNAYEPSECVCCCTSWGDYRYD